MTKILGVSAYYHDSAAALVEDGRIVAAAQEERFSRKKHDPRFPGNAINYCLEEALAEAADIEAVAFYDSTTRTLDRAVRNAATIAPAGRAGFETAMSALLGTKLALRADLRQVLGADRPLLFCDHHLSHAASAFYPSPFEDAAILTMDGVGEHTTLSIAHGQGRDITMLQEISYPHSIGLLYSAVTAYCGFKVNSGEYKLMGLAPYGQPLYADLIREKLIDVREDGSFALDMDYFGFPAGESMINARFEQLFGQPARAPESQIELHHMDVAASIQAVLEEIVLRLARHARELTGSPRLTLAGGVALNCVANGKLHAAGLFDGIWVQPAAGDAGGSLGAALYVSHHLYDAPRAGGTRDSQSGTYLGPRFSSAEVEALLERQGLVYERIEDPDARAAKIARSLADDQVVGYLNGRMEFGPRSLGARSILGDPRSAAMQTKMNLSIKYRESFRPFAPAVLAERVQDWFEFADESPYMLMVAPVREAIRLPFDLGAFRDGSHDMLEVVKQPRSSVPAVTHVDYSARLQTVHRDDNPEFHRLLSHFERLTGCPVLVNTSFNVRGEPIVMSPEDAVRCFFRTEMDLLVLEDYLLFKADQPEVSKDDSWKSEFELD